MLLVQCGPPPTCPYCAHALDPIGYNCLKCKSHGTLIRRHDNFRDILFKFCEQGRLLPKKEPLIPTKQRDSSGVVRDTNTRGDIQLQSTGSRPRAIDCAITSPLQPHYLNGAAKETGFAAEAYAREVKEARYGVGFASQGLDFTPMVVETFGAVCQKGKDLLNFVANSVAKCRSMSVSKVTQRKKFATIVLSYA